MDDREIRAQFTAPVAHMIGILGLVVVAMGFFGAYQYQANRTANEKLRLLETEVATLQNRSAAMGEATPPGPTPFTPSAGAPRGAAVLTHEETLTSVVSAAAPAVVSIAVIEEVPRYEVQYIDPFSDNPLFEDSGIRIPMFENVGSERQQTPVGTGFFIRSDGHIVTNRHVVSDARAEYVVLLSSGAERSARVLYRDPDTDVALLKIDGSGYAALSLGDSSGLQLGQTVIAIGNALGEYSNTVSIGIVSGLNRTITAQDEYGRLETLEGVIQTDAAINRGNSGGPMLDLSGRVTGVNVAMELGASNIAFAIPVNAVKAALARVLH